MIPYADTKVVYAGDGETTVFPFTFKYAEATDIKVSLYEIATDTTTVLTKDYYVDTTAGTVTYPGYPPGQEAAESERPAPLDSAHRIVIYRETEISQPVDLGSKYPLNTLEGMHDRAIMLIQEISEITARTVTVEAGSDEQPNEVIKNVRKKAELAANSASAAALSETNAKTSEAAAALSESNAEKSKNAAALSETNAKKSETMAAESATAAALSESAAAASEANAKKSETESAKSATAAAESEAQTNEYAKQAEDKFTEIKEYTKDVGEKAESAANSASAAALSETNAKTSEAAAALSESNAEKSKNAAALSETNAKNSETMAAESATAAALSESAAAASEANAKKSETESAKSATAAAESEAQTNEYAKQAEDKFAEIKEYTKDVETSKNEAMSYAALIMGQTASAWSASKTYNVDDVVIYTDGYIYRCIGYSSAGTEPDTSDLWIKIKVALDDFFTMNDGGYLVPSENPTFSNLLQLNKDGFITIKGA